MSTHLNTELTRDGIKLTTDDGEYFGHIAVEVGSLGGFAYSVVHNGTPYGGQDAATWKTMEAAEFYALAVLANRDA